MSQMMKCVQKAFDIGKVHLFSCLSPRHILLWIVTMKQNKQDYFNQRIFDKNIEIKCRPKFFQKTQTILAYRLPHPINIYNMIRGNVILKKDIVDKKGRLLKMLENRKCFLGIHNVEKDKYQNTCSWPPMGVNKTNSTPFRPWGVLKCKCPVFLRVKRKKMDFVFGGST